MKKQNKITVQRITSGGEYRYTWRKDGTCTRSEAFKRTRGGVTTTVYGYEFPVENPPRPDDAMFEAAK